MTKLCQIQPPFQKKMKYAKIENNFWNHYLELLFVLCLYSCPSRLQCLSCSYVCIQIKSSSDQILRTSLFICHARFFPPFSNFQRMWWKFLCRPVHSAMIIFLKHVLCCVVFWDSLGNRISKQLYPLARASHIIQTECFPQSIIFMSSHTCWSKNCTWIYCYIDITVHFVKDLNSIQQ